MLNKAIDKQSMDTLHRKRALQHQMRRKICLSSDHMIMKNMNFQVSTISWDRDRTSFSSRNLNFAHLY